MKLVVTIALILILVIIFSPRCTVSIPKIIWTYWDENDIPPFIVECINTWRKTNSSYKINIVTRKTLEEYIPDGNKIFNYPHCKDSVTRTSDFIRLNLLSKYGGFWIDASIILGDSLDLFQIQDEYQVVGYYIESSTKRPEYPIIENWFIAAVPNSRVIQLWLETFLRINEFEKVSEYIEWIKSEGVDIQGISSPEYLSMHVAAQYVFQKLMTPEEVAKELRLERAEDGPFEYLSKNGWNTEKGLEYIRNKNSFPRVFKMRGCERKAIENNPKISPFNFS